MRLFLDDREVDVVETDHDDGYVHVMAAYFIESGEDLNESQRSRLSEEAQDVLNEDYAGRLLDSVSDYYEIH